MELDVIKKDGVEYISARELQVKLNSSEKFANWIKRMIERSFIKEGNDFVRLTKQSTGGRPSTEYLLTYESSQRIAIVANTLKSKEIIDYLLLLSKQRQGLELVTPKEAAFAVKVINALKYVENQKEAYNIHQKAYIEYSGLSKYVYADFAKSRSKIVGWDKEKVDKALTQYLSEHSGHNKSKVMQKSMSEKLSIMDVSEAIRVAVLDILYSDGTDDELFHKFSNLVKSMAKELDIEPLKKNEDNLFQRKENVLPLQTINEQLKL